MEQFIKDQKMPVNKNKRRSKNDVKDRNFKCG